MQSSKFPIKVAIFSDIVRREDNGKLMFIGTYGNKIGVPNFPAPFSGFFTLIVSADAEKLNSKLIRLVDQSKNVFFDAEFKFQIEPDETSAFGIIGPVFFQINGPGQISLEIETKPNQWTPIENWQIEKTATTGLFANTTLSS